MDLMGTIKGSLLESYFPAGWDLARIDACAGNPPEAATERQGWWHREFEPVACGTVADFDVMMGHEIASVIAGARRDGVRLALVLPVGPMGMYRWAVYFLREWGVACDHVSGFNMDEWSDADGNTVPADHPGSFQNAMEGAFYGPLGEGTIPAAQRHFATKAILPEYGGRIEAIRKAGGRLAVVFGIGRACHIAFWEPHFAAEFDTDEAWRKPTHRIGAALHPMTIEQNAITSFKSRTTLVPAFANTIGPGIFLSADRIIGGCDGILGRGMQWQGLSFWMTLRYGPDRWVPSSYMPTLAGRLFYLSELAGPLEAECN